MARASEDPEGLVRGADTSVDVLLICMPFGSVNHPSLALGLLKAAVAPLGVRSQAVYFTIPFAKAVGARPYLHVSRQTFHKGYQVVGDWVFAEALFEEEDLDADGYVEHVLRHPSPENRRFFIPLPERLTRAILKMRRNARPFLDRCSDWVARCRPRMVGFTCMFQQKAASLALAKRLKARLPDTTIVFGGADCEGVKGAALVREFPFVDAAVSGEADAVFPEMVSRVLAGQSLSGLQGVYVQADGSPRAPNGHLANTPLVTRLDDLPLPDFDDYFEQLAAAEIVLPVPASVHIETSRGCWWGEKSQCAFCSHNGPRMVYRSKSSGRALEEVAHAAHRYPVLDIQMSDCVVDPGYFKGFLPQLAEADLDVRLFYETRPDLAKTHVRLLREAGVHVIQPGIETLSTPILKLMRKGTTALHGIQLLKWCREYGIEANWNVLWGLPDEPAEAYAEMARLVPLLAHLQPPSSAGPVTLSRFSPHFEQPDQFGITDVAPSPAYQYVYPFRQQALVSLAQYFTYGFRRPQPIEEYTKGFEDALISWKAAHDTSDLFSVDDGRTLRIWDQRPGVVDHMTALTGAQRALYLACDGRRTLAQLRQVLEDGGTRPSREHVLGLLAPLVAGGLMVRDAEAFLALAIAVGEFRPRPAAWRRYLQHQRRRAGLARLERLHSRIHLEALDAAALVGRDEIAAVRRRRAWQGACPVV